MASRRETVELAIRASLAGFDSVQQGSDKISKFGKRAAELTAQAEKLGNELDDLAKQEDLVRAYERAARTTKEANSAFRDQQTIVEKLARDMIPTVAKHRELSEQNEKLRTTANALDKELRSQKDRLAELRAGFKAAGISTRNFKGANAETVAEFKKLRTAVADGNVQLKKYKTQINETSPSLRESANSVAAMQKNLEKQRKSLRRNVSEYRRQSRELKELKGQLKQAGLNTSLLAGSQQQLTTAISTTEKKLLDVGVAAKKARNEFERRFKDPTERARAGTDKLAGNLLRVSTLLTGLSAASAALALRNVASGAIDSAKQVEALERGLSILTDTTDETSSLLNGLFTEATRLGASASQLGRPFLEFQLAVSKLNINQAEGIRLFGLYSEALLRSGGTATEVQATMLGLVQSIRQGNVQYDEFRQIASRLAGAQESFAEAFDISADSVKDFIATGNAKFDATSLIKFIEMLAERAGATGGALDGLDISHGRAKQGLLQLGAAFAETSGLADVYRSVMEGVASGSVDLADSFYRQAEASRNAADVMTKAFGKETASLKEVRGVLNALESDVKRFQKVNEGREDDPLGIDKTFDALAEVSTALDHLVSRINRGPFLSLSDKDVQEALAYNVLRLREMRHELTAIEAASFAENFFGDLDTDNATVKIIELSNRLQSFGNDLVKSQKLATDFGKGLKGLSDSALTRLSRSFNGVLEDTERFGEGVNNLSDFIKQLEGEIKVRGDNAFKSLSEAVKETNAVFDESVIHLGAYHEELKRTASFTAELRQSEKELAKTQLETAKATDAVNSTRETQNQVRRAALTLGGAEVALAEGRLNQAESEIRSGSRQLQQLEALHASRQKALQDTRALVADDKAERDAKLELANAIAEKTKKTVSDIAIAKQSLALSKAQLVHNEAGVASAKKNLAALQAESFTDDFFEGLNPDDAIAGIVELSNRLQSFGNDTVLTQALVNTFGAKLDGLSSTELAGLRKAFSDTHADTKRFGSGIENLGVFVEKLESVAFKKLSDGLRKTVGAFKESSDELKTYRDALAETAGYELELAQRAEELAAAQLDTAEAADVANSTYKTQNQIKRASLELGNAELAVAEALVSKTEDEIRAGARHLNHLEDQVSAQRTALDAARSLIATNESESESKKKLTESIANRITTTEKEIKIAERSIALAKAQLETDKEVVSTVKAEQLELGKLNKQTVDGIKEVTSAQKEAVEATEEVTASATKSASAVKDTGDKIASAWGEARAETKALSDATEQLFRQLFGYLQKKWGVAGGGLQIFSADELTKAEKIKNELGEINNELDELAAFERGVLPNSALQALIDVRRAHEQAIKAYKTEQLELAKLTEQVVDAAERGGHAVGFFRDRASAAVDQFKLLNDQDLAPLREAIATADRQLEQFQNRFEALADAIKRKEAELEGRGDEFRINEQLKDQLEELDTLRATANLQQIQELEKLERIAKANHDAEMTRLREQRRQQQENASAKDADSSRTRDDATPQATGGGSSGGAAPSAGDPRLEDATFTLRRTREIEEERRGQLQRTADLESSLIERNTTQALQSIDQINRAQNGSGNVFDLDNLARELEPRLDRLDQRRRRSN